MTARLPFWCDLARERGKSATPYGEHCRQHIWFSGKCRPARNIAWGWRLGNADFERGIEADAPFIQYSVDCDNQLSG
tara:strand:+ start:3912 stop:4142 length:231 start_codon:yes stop_codon:yes gene_type:complete